MKEHEITIEVMWSCSCGEQGGPYESEVIAEADSDNHLDEHDDDDSE